MKRLAVVLAVLLLAVPAVKASDLTFYPGFYEFEWYAANNDSIDWSGGTWTTNTNIGSIVYRRAVLNEDDLKIKLTQADYIRVYFYMLDAAGVTFNICDQDFANCTTFNTGDTDLVGDEPSISVSKNISGFTSVTIILLANGGLNLDSFELWNAGAALPTLIPTATAVPTATPPNTPVPTATILPSSTPGVPTATILPSSTPGVPTATILPSSTPGVPTATILPSSTPGVPTATILPSSTPMNTPVDTPTEINTPVDTPTEITFLPTPTEVDISLILTLIAGMTPSTPVPTDTPTPAASVCSTLAVSGQLACFDYVVTASDVHIGNLLALIFFSVWGFFLFSVLVLWRKK